MNYFRNNFETNIDQGDSFENCHSSSQFVWFVFFNLVDFLVFVLQRFFSSQSIKDHLVSKCKFRE